MLAYAGMPSARAAPSVDQRLPAPGEGVARLQIGATAPASYTVVLDGRPITFEEFNAFQLEYITYALSNISKIIKFYEINRLKSYNLRRP